MSIELTKRVQNLQERYIVLAILVAWGGLALLFGLVRLDSYGIEEGAARALILNWSVADQIVNPVVMLGSPDLRALLFAPIGIYWSGSMFAAKVFSLIIGFFAVYMMFRWGRQKETQESALIAGALLLISPIMFSQIDSMGVGPYLLLAFAMAAALDRAYRAKPRYFGGWYFLQMLWILVIVSMHPMGLAYPLALAYWWASNPDQHKNSKHIYIGIAITTVLSIAFKTGWSELAWFSNPVQILSEALNGGIIQSREEINWLTGSLATLGLIFIIALDRKNLTKDLFGLMMMLSLAIGLLASDASWATLAIALLLFRGVSMLIQFNQSRQKTGYFGQRGIITVAAFITCTFFMLQLKSHAMVIKYEILSPEDQLISELADIASNEDQAFRAASQWPGRSMLAAKRDVLPLPIGLSTPEELKEKALGSITHIIFDPYLEKNKELASQLSMLTGETETTAIMKGGALITVINHNVKLHIRPGDKNKSENPTEEN